MESTFQNSCLPQPSIPFMSQDQTQVIEKRVKSTIIRRRKEVVATPVETPAEETLHTQVTEAAILTSEEPVSAAIETPPAAQETQHQEESTEIPLVTTAATPPAETKAPPVETKAPVKHTTPLFGPRQIVSVQRQPFVSTAPKAPEVKAPLKVLPGTVLATDENDPTQKGKYKKIIKKREGELEVDLEGVGKVNSLTQLTRIAHVERIDRVFQPDRMGKRKKVVARKGGKKTSITLMKAEKRIVEMDKTIRVADMAHQMGVKANAVIAKLMAMGMMATINSELDFDTASLVVTDFQYELKSVAFDEKKALGAIVEENPENLKPRPPIVTVMGHVDHGKTSLLDAIRSANVAEGEAGGITQHIGAYTVTLPKGKITFLDTPGHEAFTAMRARGAKVTDIVILVVAADDGIMPQTIESIDHAKAAGVPIVVAVNKIDRPEANQERVKRQLSEHSLVAEDWGGETQFAPVSAKQKLGINELLERVLLQAEILDLKANPQSKAKGVVIESQLDRARGPTATLLVQQGTLKAGDIIVAGPAWGRVKAMTNYRGETALEATPSEAVEVLGLDCVPSASDEFHVVDNDQIAREVVEHRQNEIKSQKMALANKVSLESLFDQIKQGEVKELDVVLKTDVHGSLEAVSEAIRKLSTEKVKVKIIHSGVGGINESDVLLSSASKAIIIGFNVRPETNAIKTAQSEGVQIKLYKIIYDMVNDVKLAMQGLLAPNRVEKYLGRAEVRQAFTVSKVGTIAGCMVVDGKILRSADVRLLRNSVVVYEGKISSLKRFKDDTREVLQNFECGISIDGYQDIKPGDVIEAFEVELVQQEL